MKFGIFFVGQRPQIHEQYDDESKVNPNPVRRTDSDVYQDILRGAVLAEELGFDSVWIAEHAFSEHSALSSPHSMLAAIAAKTTRVKIGVACTIVPWHPPLRMAQDLATVDVISQGRLIVGNRSRLPETGIRRLWPGHVRVPGPLCGGDGHRRQSLDRGTFRLRGQISQLS